MRNIEIFLRENGIKPSYQRKRIYEYMLDNRIHPTVNDIYNVLVKDIPTLSKATVYNTMNLFREKNIVSILPIDGTESRFDIYDHGAHGHFKCTKCLELYDVKIDLPWDDIKQELEGCRIESSNINFTGICKKCMGKNKPHQSMKN